jgi:hypothetical protein
MTFSARQWAILGAIKYLALGGVALVLLLVAKLDSTGRTLAVVMTGLALPVGAFKLWRAMKLPANARIRGTVDDLPVDEREGALRRLRTIFVVAIAILAAWTAYDLRRLEAGSTDYVFTFGPSAWLYQFLGFWPAVAFLPALGVLGAWTITRRMRQFRSSNGVDRRAGHP